MEPKPSIDIARLEEARAATGVAEIADESEEIAGGTMCFGGIGSYLNQGLGIGLNGPITDQELDRFVEFYVSRGVEPQIDVCPFVDESLVAGLEKRRFTVVEFENVLSCEFAQDEQLDQAMKHPWPDAVDIVPVDPDNDAQVRTYAEVTCKGFIPEDDPAHLEAMLEIATRSTKHPRSKSFLAIAEGKAVGGGGMEATEDVSCLFGASVLPDFRRRGIQSALILRRMQHAQSRGCGLVVIHCKPGIPTERNAARLGFRVAYSKAIMRMQGPGLAANP